MTDDDDDPYAELPVHEADQARAAEAETAAFMTTLPPQAGRLTKPFPMPAWLVEVFAAHNATLAAGEGWWCDHVKAGPRPSVLAVWRPGVVVCHACAGAGALQPDLGQANVCSRCRCNWPTPLTVSAVQAGLLIALYALCPTCHEWQKKQLPLPG